MDGIVSAREVVIIGVGQLAANREREVDHAREPTDLIVDAIGQAVADAGTEPSALTRLDLLDVVQVVSWRYDDPGAVLAGRINAARARTNVSGVGGHQPVARLMELARRLSDGEGGLGLLVGGEAQSSLELLAKRHVRNPWSKEPGGVAEFPREVGGTERMWELGLVAPIRVYPLFENRLRSDLGQRLAESQDWSARMYAEFSEVAAGNDAAWRPQVYSPDEIATVTAENRMVCYPYPIRMNANNRVDQASAVLVATHEVADELGIPRDKRIRVRSGAAAADSEDILERPSYSFSPGLAHTLEKTLDNGALSADDIDVLDLYSCFPVVPKLAALQLKTTNRSLSATGGLSSFGGAHNNYSSHALVAVVRSLREDGGSGLVYANGEYLTKHAAVLLESGGGGAPILSDPVDAPPGPVAPRFLDGYVGPVSVETYTVEYDREGAPSRAWVIARTPDGCRAAARVSKKDAKTIGVLIDAERDPVGSDGRIDYTGERRYFMAGTGE